MRTNNLDDDEFIKLKRRVERLERGAPNGFSSVSRGSFRIASIDGLVVEGQERVTGILVVDGTLQVTGTQTVSGTLVTTGGLVVNGSFVINGTTTVNGSTTFVGDVDITGTVDLTGTMNVTGGGQIVVGNLTLSPGGAYGGQITAGGGGVLYLVASTVLASEYLAAQHLSLTGNSEILGNSTVYGDADVHGDTTLRDDVFLPGLPPAPPGSVANVWRDPSDGQLYRII